MATVFKLKEQWHLFYLVNNDKIDNGKATVMRSVSSQYMDTRTGGVGAVPCDFLQLLTLGFSLDPCKCKKRRKIANENSHAKVLEKSVLTSSRICEDKQKWNGF